MLTLRECKSPLFKSFLSPVGMQFLNRELSMTGIDYDTLFNSNDRIYILAFNSYHFEVRLRF